MFIMGGNPMDALAQLRLAPPEPDPMVEKLDALIALLSSLDRKTTGASPSPA